MPTAIAVRFHNSAEVYFPGQTIKGDVTVTCDKPKATRGIFIEFKGNGKVHWTDQKSVGSFQKSETETVHYRSSETYYKTKFYVWGNGSDAELPSGTHRFNFSYTLPQNIPSSFESYVGKVRHQCKAIMNIPWGFDKTFLRPYSVNSLYDLNTDPHSMVQINCNRDEYMRFFFSKSGPVSVVLRVDHSGYVPGENMLINAKISNNSNTTMNYSKARIKQIITYKAKGKKKYEERKVAEMTKPEIPAGGSDSWSNVKLQIPAVPPSKLQFCDIIDISYEFKFKVVPSGLHSDISHEAPIIIGSIPLKQYFGLFSGMSRQPTVPLPSAPVQPSAAGYEPEKPSAPGFQPEKSPAADFTPENSPQSPYNPGMSNAGGLNPPPCNQDLPPPYPGLPDPSAPVFPTASQYPEMPLPSYSECMYGVTSFTEDSDDEKGQSGTNFAPRYVSYSLADNRN